MLKTFEVVRVTYSATGLATELMYEKNSSPLKTQVVRIYGAPVQLSVVVGVPQNILRGTAPTPAANIDFVWLIRIQRYQLNSESVEVSR